MKLEDMVLVSVGDHIIELPDLFDRHIPKRWAERASRLGYDVDTKAQALSGR